MAKYIDTSINPAYYIEVWEVEDAEHGKQLVMAVDDLKYLPPADVQPVVRGRWTPHPDPNCKEWDVCTACGTGCKRREYGTNPDGTGYVTEWSYPYCPNCGSYNVGDAE